MKLSIERLSDGLIIESSSYFSNNGVAPLSKYIDTYTTSEFNESEQIDVYTNTYIPNGIDLYDPASIEELRKIQSSGFAFNITPPLEGSFGTPEEYQAALEQYQNEVLQVEEDWVLYSGKFAGKINTGLSSYRYFPKKDENLLSFNPNDKDRGYLLPDERVCGITGCDGSFFIESSASSLTFPYKAGLKYIANQRMWFDYEDYTEIERVRRMDDIYSKLTKPSYNSDYLREIIDNRYSNIDQVVFNGILSYGEGQG